MKVLYRNAYQQLIAIKNENLLEFTRGFKQGIPIALGYIPVSFTFGLMAVSGGLPVWIAILISMTNLTSAGQFAGTTLIIANAPLFEIALATFTVNIRYTLMSLSLVQKLDERIPLVKRCIIAFGITDESFTVASLEKGEISFPYMAGLITSPYWGWALGTTLGAFASSILPKSLQSSMGIALYAMFIALIIPAVKKSKAALVVALAAIFISSLLTWAPYLSNISGGWGIISATVIASTAGAIIFPREEDSV